MPKLSRRVACSALFAAAGAACALAGEAAKIAIVDSEFSPAAVTIRAGGTLAWANGDIVDHTITAKDGAFDVIAPAGKAGRIEIAKPGTVRYSCRYHPNMAGTIKVTQ
jgi:plastocyanin